MKSLAAIWNFAFSKDQPNPPSPYEIALTLGAALLSSGRFADDGGAAMDTAWSLVIPFYQGQVLYEKQGRALFDMTRHASPTEGDMSAAEARAYVAGESGSIGEMHPGGEMTHMTVGPSAMGSIDPAVIREKQRRIAEATRKVQQFASILEVARETGNETQIAAAQREFDEAAAEQSAAYY